MGPLSARAGIKPGHSLSPCLCMRCHLCEHPPVVLMAPMSTCPDMAGPHTASQKAGKRAQVFPESPGTATWMAGSLQTLYVVPEVGTGTRALVGTVRGEHGAPGLTALCCNPEGRSLLGTLWVPGALPATATPFGCHFQCSSSRPHGCWDVFTWAGLHIAALSLSPWTPAGS